MQKKNFIILLSILMLLVGIEASYAALNIPGASTIENVSIGIPVQQWVDTDTSINNLKWFAGNLLSVARFIVSGFALIYIVLIGVSMIIYSDDEGQIAKQKKQILYAGFAFLFLTVPDLAYRIFMGEQKTINAGGEWTSTESTTNFWNVTWTFGIGGFLGDVLGFLKVFAFIGAIIMFVWWAFGLIISRGKDDYKENAKNRLVYGVMGLLFLGIVEVWTRAMGDSNLQKGITDVAGSVFGMALFFAAPVAIFFLILWAYYYITSGGDEDRAKKGKNIFLYTFMATIILIAGGTFLTEFIDFLK